MSTGTLALWNGRALAQHRQYEAVFQRHAEFHSIASDIVRRANAGESVDEDIALGSRSDFAMSSVDLVNALLALRKSGLLAE